MKFLATFCVALLCGTVYAASPAERSTDAGTTAREMALTLDETIGLALRNNRTVIGARLGRAAQKFALEVAKDRYRPRASIEASARADRNANGAGEASFEPSIRIPTGGRFTLRWSEPLAGENKGAGSWEMALAQPLLKGFGPDVDTAPLRLARIDEKIHILSLRDTIAGVVTSVVRAYRAVIRANRQIEISRESLARARKQLATNRLLIRAGRMAAREIVQTEAEVANRELALIESENSLESANAALIDILDIDGISRIFAAGTLAVKRVRPDLEQSVRTALARRPDHLRALLGVATAKIGLREANNALLWDLSLNAGVKHAGGRADHSVGVTLNIPLGERSPKLTALTAVEDDLVQAQNRELNAILGYLDALTALDNTLGTTLDRWGIEIERTGDGPASVR